jgi:hypothetical protein
MRRGDGRHQEPLSLITQDTTGSSIVKINYSGSNLTPSHLSEADSHFLPIQSEVLNNLDALTPLGEIAQAAAGGKLIYLATMVVITPIPSRRLIAGCSQMALLFAMGWGASNPTTITHIEPSSTQYWFP